MPKHRPNQRNSNSKSAAVKGKEFSGKLPGQRSKPTTIALLGVCFLLILAAFFILQQKEARSLLPALGAQISQEGPTPWPTVDFSHLTPVPTATPVPEGVIAKPQPRNEAPPYDPKAEDPWRVGSAGYRGANTVENETKSATLIISGTVTQIYPARWTTLDGNRPANPHARDNKYIIYRPVLISVDRYLKGSQIVSEVLVQAKGGVIGQDWLAYGDDLYTFQQGDRVVVFLKVGAEPPQAEGRAMWAIVERYTVTSNGEATNSYSTMPVDQMLDEISKSQ